MPIAAAVIWMHSIPFINSWALSTWHLNRSMTLLCVQCVYMANDECNGYFACLTFKKGRPFIPKLSESDPFTNQQGFLLRLFGSATVPPVKRRALNVPPFPVSNFLDGSWAIRLTWSSLGRLVRRFEGVGQTCGFEETEVIIIWFFIKKDSHLKDWGLVNSSWACCVYIYIYIYIYLHTHVIYFISRFYAHVFSIYTSVISILY